MQDNSFDEIQKLAFMHFSQQMFICLPCVVVSVQDLGQQRITVQPSINFKYKDGKEEEQAVIMNVPVVFPASRTSSLTFPINVNDTVLCVFSQRGLDVFKSGSGYPATPLDYRRFSNRDAIAIPGIFPFAKAVNNPAKHNLAHSLNDMVMVHNIGTSGECEVRLKESGDIQINTPNHKVIVNCTDAEVNATSSATVTTETITLNASTMTVNVGDTNWNGNIVLTGNLTQSGTYVLDGITFNGHKHTDVTPGIGISGGPTN